MVPELKLNEFAKDVRRNSEAHGFSSINEDPLQITAWMYKEVMELFDEFLSYTRPKETRYGADGKPEGVPSEIADIVLICMIMAEQYGIDLEAAIIEKHEFNKTRPYLHKKGEQE